MIDPSVGAGIGQGRTEARVARRDQGPPRLYDGGKREVGDRDERHHGPERARARHALAERGEPEQREEAQKRGEGAHVPREHERVGQGVEGEGTDRLRQDEGGGRSLSPHEHEPKGDERQPENDPRIEPRFCDPDTGPESRELEYVLQCIETDSCGVKSWRVIDDPLRDGRVGYRKTEVNPRPQVHERRQQQGRAECAPELPAVVEKWRPDRHARQEDALQAEAHRNPGREAGDHVVPAQQGEEGEKVQQAEEDGLHPADRRDDQRAVRQQGRSDNHACPQRH